MIGSIKYFVKIFNTEKLHLIIYKIKSIKKTIAKFWSLLGGWRFVINFLDVS